MLVASSIKVVMGFMYFSMAPNVINRKEVKRMKEGIHPKYEESTVTCACGEVFTTRSCRSDIRVEVCSKCHPFYTGKQKLVDTGGRVDRIKKRYNLSE